MGQIFRFSVLAISLLLAIPVLSQEKSGDWSLQAGADLTSRYLWRGVELDTTRAPHIQPFVSLGFRDWELGLWASANTSGSYQEIDIYLKKSFGDVYVQFYDFFIPQNQGEFNFFELGSSTTEHAFEGGVGYSGKESFPLSLFAGTTFYGFDAKDDEGDIYYSTYVEASWTGKIQETEYGLALGATPFKGFYADGPAVVNLSLSATKELVLSPQTSLPVKASIMINPKDKKAWMALTISI